MSKQVEKIVIIFKNCESLNIPIERIGHFVIDDIYEHRTITSVGSVYKRNVANTVFIEIFNRKRTKKLYRINECKDITQIWLILDDLSEIGYFVDYKKPNGYENDLEAPNINQTTYITDKGDILLTIANGKDWHDFMSLNDKLDKDDTRYALLDVKETDDIDGDIFIPDFDQKINE